MTAGAGEHASWKYERDAEETRHRLAHNLDELSDRLTPGQVFDEMLTYAKGGGGTFFRALSNATRDNPVPSLLIGAGCMMFLSEKMGLNRYIAGHQGFHDGSTTGTGANGAAGRFASRTADAASSGARSVADSVRSGAQSAAETVRSGAQSAAETVRSGARNAADFASDQASSLTEGMRRGAAAVGDTISSATQRARETAHDLRDHASEAGSQVREGIQNLSNTVQDYSAELGEQIADTAGRARQQTVEGAKQASERVVSFVQEQPLLCAAVGLAIGAAIAAALPKTKAEDELMGEAADAVKTAIGEVAADQMGTAKAAATRVAHEAMGAAEREGLTPAAALDAAKRMGEKIKTVVSETTDAGQSELRNMAEAPSRQG